MTPGQAQGLSQPLRGSPFQEWTGAESPTQCRPSSQETSSQVNSSEALNPLSNNYYHLRQIWSRVIILYLDIIPFLESLGELQNLDNVPRSLVSMCQIYNKHSLPLKGNSNSTPQLLLQVKHLQISYENSRKKKLRIQHAKRKTEGNLCHPENTK